MDSNPSNLHGTVHEFTFDLETQGLRTRSHTRKYYQGRPLAEPIGISSISYGRMGHQAHVNTYTDLITPELLHQHGVTQEILDRGLLPDSLLDQVVRDPNTHYDPKKPPRWDPSLRKHGSVVDKVFRSHAKHVLKGEGITAQRDVYQQLINEWSGIASAGGKVSLGAWNVGYDMPTLFREMRRHGFSTELDNLLKSNSIRVREMSESVHAMRFESMLRSNWTPVMTDRSVIQAAIDRGLTSLSPKDAKNLGAIVEHTGLRQFMDDVKGGREAFKSRSQKWLSAQTAGSAHAQAAAEDVVNRLSKITNWQSFTEFVEHGHNNAHALLYGNETLHSVLGAMYGTGTQAHILGDVRTLHSTMHFAPTAGKFSAFSFVGGAKLGDVSGALVKHAKELEVSESVASEISALLANAHSADEDRTVMERTAVELDRIRRNDALFEKWTKIDQAQHHDRAARRVGELFEDVVRQGHGAEGADEIAKILHGGGKQMKRGYGRVGNPELMLWTGLGLAAAYVIGKHNETEKPPTIEGFRRPEGAYDTVQGINASDLPFSNISAFGSGYDQWVGHQQQPERTKIVRVLDGDTVQFYRGGRLITGRLAGVDTPETISPKKMPSPLGREASNFTKNLLTGQDVWIRQYTDPKRNASVDAYGRELVYVDFDGMSVNSELIRRGYSDPQFVMPAPVIQGSEIYGYLKNRMVANMDAVIQQLKSYVPDPQRSPDPFMWTALGTVSSMTGEDDLEDTDPREQPVGYGGVRAQQFNDVGFAGYVQQLDQDAIGHTIRDHATQLHRLPAMPRTRRGRRSHGMFAHAERAATMDI